MRLEDRIKTKAGELGFLGCGITGTSSVAHGVELDEWLAKGYAGTMRYLHRQARRRKDPSAIVPEARSVVVICDSYYYEEAPRSERPFVARYAGGMDYHVATRNKMNELADWLLENGAKTARVYVDAGPVPEKELAQRAGLGWIGKNTMLIDPRAGSYFVLATIFTDLALDQDRPMTVDHCGSCTRCLDACPTQAFVAPRVLDATRCISYLTIEHKGPIPPEFVADFQGWAFGCDICNDVCPWNEKFSRPSARPEFTPRPVWQHAGRADFFEGMDEPLFEALFADSPLERPGLEGMRRNWIAALTGDHVRDPDSKSHSPGPLAES
jgi:epoxyqueuosine reductase